MQTNTRALALLYNATFCATYYANLQRTRRDVGLYGMGLPVVLDCTVWHSVVLAALGSTPRTPSPPARMRVLIPHV